MSNSFLVNFYLFIFWTYVTGTWVFSSEFSFCLWVHTHTCVGVALDHNSEDRQEPCMHHKPLLSLVSCISSKQGLYGAQVLSLCLCTTRSTVDSWSQMVNGKKKVNPTTGILNNLALTGTLSCFLFLSLFPFCSFCIWPSHKYTLTSTSCCGLLLRGWLSPLHYSWVLTNSVDVACLMATRHKPVFVPLSTSAEAFALVSPSTTAAWPVNQLMKRKQTALDQQKEFVFGWVSGPT